MLPTRTTVLLFLLGLLAHLTGLAYAVLHALLVEKFPGAAGWMPGTGYSGSLHWLVLGYLAVVFLVFLLDGLLAARSCRPRLLRVKRERPAHLSVGIDNEVALVLENAGARRLRLLVRDEP